MNPHEIRELLQRDPFEPFNLRSTSGATYNITDPNTVALGRNRLFIAFADKSDRWAAVPYLHIAAAARNGRHARTPRTERRKQGR